MPERNDMEDYNDFALVLAWPNVTARGDERWYTWLKNLGIVKNLNFKVGHAAIVLIDSKTGDCHYYDFGRYVTPRGCGRARSARTDPNLTLETKCRVESTGQTSHIVNIEDLLHELHVKQLYTHGDDDMYASITGNVCFAKASHYAIAQCERGAVGYSAFSARNNNCSRFVQRVLKAGLPNESVTYWQITRPETFVASPISNVINAREDHQVIRYSGSVPSVFSMNRLDSMRFFLKQVSANFFWGDYTSLQDDTHPGYQSEPSVRPPSVPLQAQWLGGIGEGAWHETVLNDDGYYVFKRYTMLGLIDIERVVRQTEGQQFTLTEPYRFTYTTHAGQLSVLQHGCLLTFAVLSEAELIIDTRTAIHYAS